MLVDFYLRDMESSLLAELVQLEHTPIQSAMFVSALSQMWIFAAYELLRTWRQRIRELKREAQNVMPQASGAAILEDISELFWRGQVHRIQNDHGYIAELDKASSLVEPVFRRIESLRMNLAKHEVPKKSQRAIAPGYGRIDYSDGSIYWQVDMGGRVVDIVSRRSLSDGLRRAVIGHTLAEEEECLCGGACLCWRGESDRIEPQKIKYFGDPLKCSCCSKIPSHAVWFYRNARGNLRYLCHDCGVCAGLTS
jgi:hypothetical protein